MDAPEDRKEFEPLIAKLEFKADKREAQERNRDPRRRPPIRRVAPSAFKDV
jgi:hypothetical protein